MKIIDKIDAVLRYRHIVLLTSNQLVARSSRAGGAFIPIDVSFRLLVMSNLQFVFKTITGSG